MIFDNFTPTTWAVVGVAFILGVILKSFFCSSSKTHSGEELKKLQDELNSANKTISSLKSSVDSGDSKESQKLAAELKEATEKIKSLEKCIASSADGDDFKVKLLEEKKTIEDKVKKLNEELSKKGIEVDDLQKKVASKETENAKIENDLRSSLNNLKEANEKNTQLEEQKKAVEKNVKKLKDELDDKEEEIDDLKKKVKSKETERVRLEDELHSSQKNLKEANEKNQDLEQKNTAAKKEIEEYKESNSFVSTLLSAPAINAEDTKKIEHSINTIERFVENELKPFYYSHFQLGDSAVRMLGGKDGECTMLKTWVAQSKKTWLTNKKVISFIGEFSAGKTTIVNRILKQDNKDAIELPTSSKATTAIPTYISGGKLTKYTFVSPDDSRKDIAKQKFENVKKETLAKFEGINRLIKYFVMEYDNKNLQNLSILDTPGFQSNDPEDERRTMDVVNESDALFWVVDVNKGELNKKSVGILRNFKKPLYIILNQCDSKSPAEVENAREKIKQTAKNEGLHAIDVIPFGFERYQLSAIMDVIEKIPMANTNHYIDELIAMVKNDEPVYKNLLSESIKGVNEWDERLENWTNTFNNNVRNLIANARNAESRPHFEKHLFRKDNYEMSQYEFQQLKNDLSGCVSCSNAIKQNCEDQMENVRNRTIAQNNKFEVEDLNKEFLRLSATLTKLVKEYKNAKGL